MPSYDIVSETQTLLERIVEELFPEDEVACNYTMIHLPHDGQGLLPTGVIYLQVMGTDEIDGIYASQIIFPSSVSEENVRFVVQDLAIKMADRCKQIRASLAAGHEREVTAMALPPSAVTS